MKFIELTPKNFEGAPVRGGRISNCTPTLPEDRAWTGIVIRAPERVRVLSDIPKELESRFAYEVPICGISKVYIPETPDPVGLQLEITDFSSDQVSVHELKRSPMPGAKVIHFEKPPVPPGLELNPEMKEIKKRKRKVQSTFNYNLADYLPLSDIQQTRRYRIRVVLREHRSNAVELEVSRKTK